MKSKEINGFVIKEMLKLVTDDGIRYLPLDDEDRNSPVVPVKMTEASAKTVKVVCAEVEGEEFFLKGFSFETACDWAENCPQDLANLIFD